MGEKEVRIKITQHASNDLESLYEYITQDNPAAAKKTILKVLDAIESLKAFPTIGRSGRLPYTRELVISGTPFIVIYQIKEDIIFVIRVYHASRRWPPG